MSCEADKDIENEREREGTYTEKRNKTLDSINELIVVVDAVLQHTQQMVVSAIILHWHMHLSALQTHTLTDTQAPTIYIY